MFNPSIDTQKIEDPHFPINRNHLVKKNTFFSNL